MTTPAACVPTFRFIPSSLQRDVDHVSDLRVLVVFALEVRARHRLRQIGRDRSFHRHELAHLIDAIERYAEHAADVLHRGLRGQRAEGADLRHRFDTVLPLHVVDDLIAPVLAEVDVDVGRFAAVRVEEALEEQVVFERIDVAQVEHVAHDRAAAGAARRARDAVLAGEADEVPDDEEVAREAHPADDVELVFEPLARRLGRFGAVAIDQPLPRTIRGGRSPASSPSAG